jgi:putative copper export protein
MSGVTPTLIALWIHIPFVTAWIGLVIFDVLSLLVPGLTVEQRARMIAWSRPLVGVAMPIILITGIMQSIDNPVRPISSFGDLNSLKATTIYGYALFWKHGFVLATFGLTTLARFWLAPRLLALHGNTGGSMLITERTLFWVSAANLAACLGALIFATRMVWDLH